MIRGNFPSTSYYSSGGGGGTIGQFVAPLVLPENSLFYYSIQYRFAPISSSNSKEDGCAFKIVNAETVFKLKWFSQLWYFQRQCQRHRQCRYHNILTDRINIICFYYYHYYYLKNKIYRHYDHNRTVVQIPWLVAPQTKSSIHYRIRISVISAIMGTPMPTPQWTLKQQGRDNSKENRKQ